MGNIIKKAAKAVSRRIRKRNPDRIPVGEKHMNYINDMFANRQRLMDEIDTINRQLGTYTDGLVNQLGDGKSAYDYHVEGYLIRVSDEEMERRKSGAQHQAMPGPPPKPAKSEKEPNVRKMNINADPKVEATGPTTAPQTTSTDNGHSAKKE